MRLKFGLALVLLLWALPAMAGSSWQTCRKGEVSFSVPAGWEVKYDPSPDMLVMATSLGSRSKKIFYYQGRSKNLLDAMRLKGVNRKNFADRIARMGKRSLETLFGVNLGLPRSRFTKIRGLEAMEIEYDYRPPEGGTGLLRLVVVLTPKMYYFFGAGVLPSSGESSRKLLAQIADSIRIDQAKVKIPAPPSEAKAIDTIKESMVMGLAGLPGAVRWSLISLSMDRVGGQKALVAKVKITNPNLAQAVACYHELMEMFHKLGRGPRSHEMKCNAGPGEVQFIKQISMVSGVFLGQVMEQEMTVPRACFTLLDSRGNKVKTICYVVKSFWRAVQNRDARGMGGSLEWH